jgi:hypothetical protein
VRRHPFARASLQDDDVSVDFAAHTTPRDRVAVIVTEPLTKDETWTAFARGELSLDPSSPLGRATVGVCSDRQCRRLLRHSPHRRCTVVSDPHAPLPSTHP